MEVEEIKEPHAKLQALEAGALHDIEQFASCSLADKVKTQKLSLAVQQKLSAIRALTRDLELLYEELDSDEERQAVAAVLSQHKAEYVRIQQAFKGAALQQRRAAAVSAVEERKELLAGAADPAARQRALATQAGLVEASEGVTEGLRRTRQVLAEQLEHTSTTLAAMEQSHSALGKTKDEYHAQAVQLKTSKGLLGTLSWQQKAERVLLWVGLLVFTAVVLYIAQRRLGYFVPASLHPTALISTAAQYLRPGGSDKATAPHLQPPLPSVQHHQQQQRRPGDVPGLPPHFEHRQPRSEQAAAEHAQRGGASPQAQQAQQEAPTQGGQPVVAPVEDHQLAEETWVQKEGEEPSHPEHAAPAEAAVGTGGGQGGAALQQHAGQAFGESEPTQAEAGPGPQGVPHEEAGAAGSEGAPEQAAEWERQQQEEQERQRAAALVYEQQRAALEAAQQQAAMQAAAQQQAAYQAAQQAQWSAPPSQELPQGHVAMPGGTGQAWDEVQMHHAQQAQQAQQQEQHQQHAQHQQYDAMQHGHAAAVAPEGAPEPLPEASWQAEPRGAAVEGSWEQVAQEELEDGWQPVEVEEGAAGEEAPGEVVSGEQGAGGGATAGAHEEL